MDKNEVIASLSDGFKKKILNNRYFDFGNSYYLLD